MTIGIERSFRFKGFLWTDKDKRQDKRNHTSDLRMMVKVEKHVVCTINVHMNQCLTLQAQNISSSLKLLEKTPKSRMYGKGEVMSLLYSSSD